MEEGTNFELQVRVFDDNGIWNVHWFQSVNGTPTTLESHVGPFKTSHDARNWALKNISGDGIGRVVYQWIEQEVLS